MKTISMLTPLALGFEQERMKKMIERKDTVKLTHLVGALVGDVGDDTLTECNAWRAAA